MRHLDRDFPLVIMIAPMRGYDAESISEMNGYCEQLWARGERYALITHTPLGAAEQGAQSRRLIADWANEPRVRELSKKHCVASATITTSTIARGALTAFMWLWKPPAPFKAAATPEEAVDFCLNALVAEGLRLPRASAEVRRTALDLLHSRDVPWATTL